MERGASASNSSSSLAAQLAQLRDENRQLLALLTRAKAANPSAFANIQLPGVDSSGGSSTANHDAAHDSSSHSGSAGAPRRSFGEMKLWVGTWNMGAVDPFLEMDLKANPDGVHRMLQPFIPVGYDLYVLGVQEGISDKVFEAVEQHTSTFRVPLNAKLYPARDVTREGAQGTKIRSRRVGRAVKLQSFIDEARAGVKPEPVTSTADMLDRVWGRGDGAMLTPKFTGIAVFVAPVVAPYCRLLGMYKHSFGASEGSKGGVGVALGLYDVTVAFVNVHMASKRTDMRRQQYQELVDRLGAKLGGRGFGLNEEFHHIIWMGDLNVHCKGVSAGEAVNLIRSGRHLQLLLNHDELLMERENETSFFEYEEPLMGPRFYPTYKKQTVRGKVDTRDPEWVNKVYLTAYKEPFYKGGRTMERVPAWTDRVLYHSLPDRWGELLPESLDPSNPDKSLHNYHAVNDALDVSDHSPVFSTYSLQICADDVDEGLQDMIEAQQAVMGYRQQPLEGEGEGGSGAANSAGEEAASAPRGGVGASGVMDDVAFSALHPSRRPLIVQLTVGNIMVEYKGAMVVPRAVSVLFPLPYEDSNEIPERAKIARAGGLFSFGRPEARESVSATLRTLVSRQSKLETLHMLIKVSLDDNTKAQCVICMRDGGFVGVGSHMNTFLQPLVINGVPLKVDGKQANVQFTLEMTAYERGGTQTAAPPTSGIPGQTGAITIKPRQPIGPAEQRKKLTNTTAPAPMPSAAGPAPAVDGAAPAAAAAAATGGGKAAFRGLVTAATGASPARAPKPPAIPLSGVPPATPGSSAAGRTGGASAAVLAAASAFASGTPSGGSEVARLRAQQMMAAARARAAASGAQVGAAAPSPASRPAAPATESSDAQ